MSTAKPTIAILHYTSPPVIGGVETVINAHTRIFMQMGYPVVVIAGQGSKKALPPGCKIIIIPEIDSQYPDILAASAILDQGEIPDTFHSLMQRLLASLGPSHRDISRMPLLP